MKSIYRKDDDTRLFIKSFCAYFDILGFREKIKKNEITFFEKYMAVLEKELKNIDDENNLDGGKKSFELKVFTDNFVLGHPWDDEYGEFELGVIFTAVANIQFSFAVSDVFIRGAITMSDLYMDENIVLGQAIIDAYDLEIEKAIYPRIILSDNVVETIKKHIAYYAEPLTSPQNITYR